MADKDVVWLNSEIKTPPFSAYARHETGYLIRRLRRLSQNFSQKILAQKLKSSQSRIAKMEAEDTTASLDLLIRGFLALELPVKNWGRL